MIQSLLSSFEISEKMLLATSETKTEIANRMATAPNLQNGVTARSRMMRDKFFKP
jgi:hypothetical protein